MKQLGFKDGLDIMKNVKTLKIFAKRNKWKMRKANIC